MKKFLLLLSILVSGGAFAQTKIKDGTVSGPVIPNAAAILELESNNKGLLLTRVELANTTTWGLAGAGVQGMLVYNTLATTTSTDAAYPVLAGGKGVYYWDGTGWVAAKMAAGLEPWNVESTSSSASLNTQNIYQNGNVGIGDFTGTNPIAKLDVRGAVRGGGAAIPSLGVSAGPHTGTIGANSVAFGYRNEASGDLSFAAGGASKAKGLLSFAAGSTSEAIADNSTAMGFKAIANGYISFAMGAVVTSSSAYETVFGENNAIKTGGPAPWIVTDALFQVGNGNHTGPGVGSPNNALTILKNGHTGIGLEGAEALAKPTERLDIGNSNGSPSAGYQTGLGGVRIRAINSAAYTGDFSTNKIVVADANGILKTVNRAYSATTALPTGETWVDGKKVYKKVYPVTLNAAGDAGTITIDTGLGPVLNAEFAQTLQSGVYKRATLSGSSYNPSTGVLVSLSYSGAGITFPITLNLVVTYVEP